MIGCTLLAAIGAMALFGLATQPHYGRRCGSGWTATRAATLRGIAWCLTGLTFALGFSAWGAVYGAIGAAGAMMLAAGAVFLTLNLAPVRSSHQPGSNRHST